MAQSELICVCGFGFSVDPAKLGQKTSMNCPMCGQAVPVKRPQAAAAPAKPAAAKAPAQPAATAEAFERAQISGMSSGKKWAIIGTLGGAALVIIVIVIVLVRGSGENPYEKQVEALEREKKAQDQNSTAKKPSLLDDVPKSTAPAAPTKPGPMTKSSSSELKPPPPIPIPPLPGPGANSKTPATPPPPAPPQGGSALPAETAQKVRGDVLSLHPFYLALVVNPSEKTRLEALLAAPRASTDDNDFVQAILVGAKLKAVRDEKESILQALPTLEKEATEGLPVDRIVFADGRPISCKILDEGPEIIKIDRRMASGIGGQQPVRRDNLKAIEKGKGVGAEFPAKWDTAQKGTVAAQVEVMTWCRDNALLSQAKLLAYTILKTDPSNSQARTEAGLPADPVQFASEMSKGTIIAYQGKNWNAKELKEKLLKDGYVLIGGQWYSKKEKMISVPGLFRSEKEMNKSVVFGGSATVLHEADITYRVVQDPATGAFSEVPDTAYKRRFYGPKMVISQTNRPPSGSIPPTTFEQAFMYMTDEGDPPAGTAIKGELTITVSVGDPIIEASVMTLAEVKPGASIAIYHAKGFNKDDERVKLYSCDSKETGTHVIPPDLVRGKTEVLLVAAIDSTAAYATKNERRRIRPLFKEGKIVKTPALDVIHQRLIPEFKALLFPSNQNTIEVFRLRAMVADPAPGLTKLFASCPDVLK